MNAVKLWTGCIESSALGTFEYRQIQVFAQEVVDDSIDGPVKFAVLGSGSTQDAKDIVTIGSIEHGKITEPVMIDLPQRGGRIVPSSHQLWWQSPEGAIFQGQFLFDRRAMRWAVLINA
jgi:hypothetical protein